MLKKIKTIIICCIAAIYLSACNNSQQIKLIYSEADLHGLYVGCALGEAQLTYVMQTFNKDSIKVFNSVADLMNGVSFGKCDAVIIDETIVDGYITPESHLGGIVSDNIPAELGIAFNKEDTLLCNQLNSVLRELKETGKLDEIFKRWRDKNLTLEEKYQYIEQTPTGKPFPVAVEGDVPPYEFFTNGKNYGAEIEIVQIFAKRFGYKPEYQLLNLSGMIAALSSGRIKMIATCLNITPERKEKVLFSEPFGHTRGLIIAKSERLPNVEYGEAAHIKKNVWDKIKESFHRNVITENRYNMYLKGFKITIIITFGTIILGTILGGILCFLRMSKKKWIQEFAILYIDLMRGTPVLVFLMIMYYIILAPFNTDGIIVACITFAMNMSAFVSEMIRSGIESIDKGQTEAGLSLGLSSRQTFKIIVLPQVVRNILPVFKGEAISQLKGTAIVGYIAVMDLTKASDLIRSRTFDPFFPLIIVAIIYLISAWIIGKLLDAVSNRL